MRTEIYFIAEDGTRFENEYECKEYELKTLYSMDCWGFEAYAENFSSVTTLDKLDRAFYFHVTNSNFAEDCMDEVYNFYGYSVPNNVNILEDGIWYQYLDGDWINLTEEIEEMKIRIDSLNIEI